MSWKTEYNVKTCNKNEIAKVLFLSKILFKKNEPYFTLLTFTTPFPPTEPFLLHIKTDLFNSFKTIEFYILNNILSL